MAGTSHLMSAQLGWARVRDDSAGAGTPLVRGDSARSHLMSAQLGKCGVNPALRNSREIQENREIPEFREKRRIPVHSEERLRSGIRSHHGSQG